MGRRCIVPAVFAALLAAPGLFSQGLAQDFETDVVYARQVLMGEIEAQMAPADFAAIGDPFDMDAARTGAQAVSAMLGVAPYLFPEGTDSGATADGDFPSTALKAVWESPEAFKAMAEQAATMAFDLSQVTDEAAFREQAAALRAMCNACHAAYMQPYEAPN